MTNPLTCKQNQKKSLMLKIVKKTPTIKQFVYYFYTITKWQQKKIKIKIKKSLLPPLW